MPAANPDFELSFPSMTIALIRPVTPEAQAWWDDNVSDEAQMWAGAYVVEPRYVEPIVEGILQEGMTIQ